MRRVLSHLEIRSARPSPCTPHGTDELSPPAGGSSAGRRQTIHLLPREGLWKQRKQTLKSRLSINLVGTSEAEVNEVLKSWCEGADATDFVSVRRYLIDYHILDREDGGKYWLIGAWKVPAAQ
jgi:hypothetical protein